jgi:phage portal protein BeeE
MNAYKTLHLYPGADATVVGSDLRSVDFRQVQGAGETRIAAAAGVPPVIVGLSEGLQAATYSNYAQARRRFADGTIHPLWQNAAGSLEALATSPGDDVRLWYDASDVPFLREDEKDAAEIASTQANTINSLVTAGYTPTSAVAALEASDWRLLEHSGLYSVQLQPAGTLALPAPSMPTQGGDEQ